MASIARLAQASSFTHVHQFPGSQALRIDNEQTTPPATNKIMDEHGHYPWVSGPSPPSDYDWEGVDPLVHKYGDDPFVKAAKDAQAVQQLLDDGAGVSAEGVLAAAEGGYMDSLEVIFETGISPNIRSATACAPDAGVRMGWEVRDVAVSFRDVLFYDEWQEWYPLQAAARTTLMPVTQNGIERQIGVMRLLLKKGADPYAVYREPLWRQSPYPYPGEAYDEQVDPPWEDKYAEAPPVQGRAYGTRSVIHSLFEDGGQLLPFFDKDFPLALELRDGQGRTILHSCCRSALGADALVGVFLRDIEPNRYNRKVFASIDDTNDSMFHALRLRGADLLAVDNNGKHILHHLLDANRPWSFGNRPPVIRNAFRYVLANLTKLVNKPDRHGTHPLHSALQLWRRHPYFSDADDEAGLESIIQQLLAAGADPLARDGRGNTVLHYLAVNGLAEQLHGDTTRRTFRYFLNLGVNVNTRNAAGRTAIELLLDDDGSMAVFRASNYLSTSLYGQLPSRKDVDAEVLEVFDRAGARWTESGGDGATLLHIVARHPTNFTAATSRAMYLVEKGVNALAKDSEGRTAVDVAEKHSATEVLDVLRPQSL